MGQSYKVRDAAVSPAAFALPAAAGSTHSASIDTGNAGNGDFLADAELLITAPALAVGPLPNAATVTYAVQHSDDDVTFTDIYPSLLVQTGAGGAGAAAATKRLRLPTDVKRYVRLRATTANTPGDASASNAQLDLLF